MDELAIFGGQTRVLLGKKFLHEASDVDPAPAEVCANETVPASTSEIASQSLPSSTSRLPVELEDIDMQDVHPSLIAYMSMLSSDSTPYDYAGFSDESFNLPLNQPTFNAEEEFLPFMVPTPNFFSQQATNSLAQHDQIQTSTANPAFDADFFSSFEQVYQEPSLWHTSNSQNLNVPGSGDDDTYERWMNFINGKTVGLRYLDTPSQLF